MIVTAEIVRAANKKIHDIVGVELSFEQIQEIGLCVIEAFQAAASDPPRLVDQITEKSYKYVLEQTQRGINIAVPGFKRSVEADQVYVEVYDDVLQVHVWDGSKEDPVATIKIDPEEDSPEEEAVMIAMAEKAMDGLKIEDCLTLEEVEEKLELDEVDETAVEDMKQQLVSIMDDEYEKKLDEVVGAISNAYHDIGGGAEQDAGYDVGEMSAVGILLAYIDRMGNKK